MDSNGGGSGLVVRTVFKTAGRRQWWLRWVRFPHAPAISLSQTTSRGFHLLAVLAAWAAITVASPSPARSQIPFPTPPPANQDTSRADTVKVPAFRFQPPVSPMAALARSMLLPGWGQAVLGRRVTGGVLVFWEGVTLTMMLKAQHQLHFYRQIQSPKAGAKKQEVQDWAVLLIFNHLFAGTEAFVSAQLWDFPVEPALTAVPGGIGAGLRIRIR